MIAEWFVLPLGGGRERALFKKYEEGVRYARPDFFQFRLQEWLSLFVERKDFESFTYRFCSVTLVEEGRNRQ
jgi:hypothetical protein